MSIWSDCPEFFDEWIESYALEGHLGSQIQKEVEDGVLIGSDLWYLPELQNQLGELGHRAAMAYVERMMP